MTVSDTVVETNGNSTLISRLSQMRGDERCPCLGKRQERWRRIAEMFGKPTRRLRVPE